MKKSVGKIIAKVLFLGIEILSVFIIVMACFSSAFAEGFLLALLFIAFVSYAMSVVTILIVRVFNFLHEFDDYDDWGEFFGSLKYAPLTLVWHVLKHIANIFAYSFGKDEPYHAPYSTYHHTPSANVKGANAHGNSNVIKENTDSRDTTIFTNMVEKKAKQIAHSTPPARYLHWSSVHVSWEKGYGFDASVSPFGVIRFSGTLVFQSNISNDIQEYDRCYIEECVNETADNIEQQMSNAIDEIRRTYKGYDRSFRIDVNISYKTKGMRVR